jgi:hypothetical protein
MATTTAACRVPNSTAVAPGVDFSKIDRDGDGFVSEMEAYKNLKAIFAANGKSIPAGLFAKIK